MRFAVFVSALAAAGAAHAHPGHLAEVAGHGHWLGAAAVGAAIAIGLWAALKDRKPKATSEEEEPEVEGEDAEPQEA